MTTRRERKRKMLLMFRPLKSYPWVSHHWSRICLRPISSKITQSKTQNWRSSSNRLRKVLPWHSSSKRRKQEKILPQSLPIRLVLNLRSSILDPSRSFEKISSKDWTIKLKRRFRKMIRISTRWNKLWAKEDSISLRISMKRSLKRK